MKKSLNISKITWFPPPSKSQENRVKTVNVLGPSYMQNIFAKSSDDNIVSVKIKC